MRRYLKPTEAIDCDTQSIKESAQLLTTELETAREKAVALFYFVRDEIKHNPFTPGYLREHFKASAILERRKGYCQHKAILLVALARASGIPARLGFVDIHDHRLPDKLIQIKGGNNLFIFHGYSQLYLDGRWVHASPSYDYQTCRRNRFVPVDFDGLNDAKDSRYDEDGKLHIEYVRDRGQYEDFPWDELCKATEEFAAKMGRDLPELISMWWGRKPAERQGLASRISDSAFTCE
ncbi:MAG: transglutaminase [Dehalococcoidia bacterium]|nr:MAG: transglutaminase [Dehalococcoidia bacterium]